MNSLHLLLFSMHSLLTVTQPSDLSTDPEAGSELPGRSSDALGVVNASWEMHSYRYRRCMFEYRVWAQMYTCKTCSGQLRMS